MTQEAILAVPWMSLGIGVSLYCVCVCVCVRPLWFGSGGGDSGGSGTRRGGGGGLLGCNHRVIVRCGCARGNVYTSHTRVDVGIGSGIGMSTVQLRVRVCARILVPTLE